MWGVRERERLRERAVGTNPTYILPMTWRYLESGALVADRPGCFMLMVSCVADHEPESGTWR